MATIRFTRVSDEEEVRQILDLQAQNLAPALDSATAQSQGFLTVQHEPDVLQRMNRAYPSVIAKAGGQLAGYCLVMPPSFASEVPVLAPMFDLLRTLTWQGRPLDDWRWFVMGQVCVAKAFRGQGVFDGLYRMLAAVCRDDFDCVITEISTRNARSLRAHERVGFEPMHLYTEDLTGEAWQVVGMGLGKAG